MCFNFNVKHLFSFDCKIKFHVSWLDKCFLLLFLFFGSFLVSLGFLFFLPRIYGKGLDVFSSNMIYCRVKIKIKSWINKVEWALFACIYFDSTDIIVWGMVLKLPTRYLHSFNNRTNGILATGKCIRVALMGRYCWTPLYGTSKQMGATLNQLYHCNKHKTKTKNPVPDYMAIRYGLWNVSKSRMFS